MALKLLTFSLATLVQMLPRIAPSRVLCCAGGLVFQLPQGCCMVADGRLGVSGNSL